MKLPEFFERVPRPLAILAVPVIALIIVAAVVLSSGPSSPRPVDRLAAVPTTALGDFGPTLTPEALATPEPTVEPTPAPAANRMNCTEIRGTDYQSDVEAEWYRTNCANANSSGGAAGGSGGAAATGGGISSSGDRLVLQRLGINAPVNYRTVPSDGQLGDPAGPYDVVWYDFRNFSGMGGYPGEGGNAVLAGHVDYRTVGPAVFYQLRNVSAGDVIQYRRSDGQTISYSVTSVSDILPGANWDPIVSKGGAEAITLITCNGEFNYNTREYSHRRVVKAVRI